MKMNKWKHLKKITKVGLLVLVSSVMLIVQPVGRVGAETLAETENFVDVGGWELQAAATATHWMPTTIFGNTPMAATGLMNNTPGVFVGDAWYVGFPSRWGNVFTGWPATGFVKSYVEGTVPAVPSSTAEMRMWEFRVFHNREVSFDWPVPQWEALNPTASEMAALLGEGNAVYWGDEFTTDLVVSMDEMSIWRRFYIDRNLEGGRKFDPTGTVDYIHWSGYMVEQVDGVWREWCLYDLRNAAGNLIATVPLFYVDNRWGVYAADGGVDIPGELHRTFGVSPLINGLAPIPPMIEDGNNSEWLAPIAPFDRQVEMVGSAVGSGLSYEVVGAVSEMPLTLSDGGEEFTYSQTFIPEGTFADLIDENNQYKSIGTGTLEVTITDYEGDETIFNQSVVVKTNARPNIRIYYGTGARDVGGALLMEDTPYTAEPNATLAGGGEEGWSNQPLRVEVDPTPITGNFETVLTMPDGTIYAQENELVSSILDYFTNTPAGGVYATGILTEVGNRGETLSNGVNALMKIDTEKPRAVATHVGGMSFTDDSYDVAHHPDAPNGSEISTVTPPRIAIVPVGSDTAPDFDEYVTFEDIPSVIPYGEYAVWVWARDKAGNIDEYKAYERLVLGGKVEIRKDTDEGATLHAVDCIFPLALDAEHCGEGCIEINEGSGVDIEELSDITYNLYIENLDVDNVASGTFEDYLPMGVEIDAINNPPIVISEGSEVDLDLSYTKIEIPGDVNDGRWKVSGSYTGLEAEMTIQIKIPAIVPAFDKGAGATNIFRNQATMTWEYDNDGTVFTGSSESNFALHRTTAIPTVETQFTKVGADALTTGLEGAEFALYRLDDEAVSEPEDIVDPDVLEDNGWTRIQEDGENADSINDVFVTAGMGEVNLGALPSGIYTLIETKAPAGYGLPVGQWILTIDHLKGDSGGADDWKIEFVGKSDSIMPPAAVRDWSGSGTPAYRIINARPFSIGVSGLAGTRGLLLIGFALMATAGNVYIMKTYKQRKKSQ